MDRNDEAERAVLAGCLLSPAVLERVSAKLTPGDFFLEAHGRVYSAILATKAAGMAVDALTVQETLGRKGWGDDFGVGWLTALENDLPRSQSVEHYARIVGEGAFRRRAVRATAQLGRTLADRDVTPKDGLLAAQRELEGLWGAVWDTDGPRPLRDLVADWFAARSDGTLRAPLSWGMPRLDAMCGGGIRPGELAIVAARPGRGKSLLLQQLAGSWPVPVVVFSLEMDGQSLVDRMLSAATGTQLQAVRAAKEPSAEVLAALERVASRRVMVDDTPGLSLNEIRARAKQAHKRGECGAVIVDYLQLAKVSEKGQSREQEVAAVSRGLKGLARELGVPVLAASQMGRDVERRGEGAEPRLSDLRESGAIENDADIVVLMGGTGNSLKLIVAKNRNGDTGSVPIMFDPRRPGFRQAPM